MEDPSFKDFTTHLIPERSITDKREESFAINKDGLFYVSGKGEGYLRTNSKYGDYQLVLEYKWGEQPRRGINAERGRSGGLYVRSFGEDALLSGRWQSGVAVKLHEPTTGRKRVLHTGDFIVLANKDDEGIKSPTQVEFKFKADPDGQRYWNLDGRVGSFPEKDEAGARLNGFRGEKSVERPAGDWNRIEVVCRGDTIRVILNGRLVNECTKVAPLEGFVSLQTNSSELWVRKWELWPLDSIEQNAP